MDKKECTIIIPIYKKDPDKFEKASYIQCLNILPKHTIYLVTHKELDTTYYIHEAKKKGIIVLFEYFERKYFENIHGYNQLMLNIEFYKRFREYNYMLLYQLDAYVFKDELLYWCKKGYDYIGAPWFERYSTHEEGYSLWAVGNGGFSLRKISYFIKVLSWKLPVKKTSFKNFIFNFNINYILYLLGRKNTIRYHLNNYKQNEDAFFCIYLKDTWISPKLPSLREACHFSFEKSPSYLHKLCNDQLPFGCHAFNKYEFDSFWHLYISIY